MGTSASNNGPSGRSNLLPTWYGNRNDAGASGGGGEGAGDGSEANTAETGDSGMAAPAAANGPVNVTPAITGNWKNAKGAFTRYSKNTAGSDIRKAARNYVRTLGGASKAKSSSSKGISVGGGLATFLGSVASGGSGGGGLDATLESLGLVPYVGSSSEETLARIADAIAPEGSTNDEAIARDAILETLDTLYTGILDAGGDLNALEAMSSEMIKEAVTEYVGNYIYKKWLYELGLAVEKNTVSERTAIKMEKEIKEFIDGEVRLSLRDKTIRDFTLSDSSNQEIIDNIFQLAYSTIEK